MVTPGKIKKRTRIEGAVDVEYWKDWTLTDMAFGQIPINMRIEGYLTGLVGLRVSLPGVAVV